MSHDPWRPLNTWRLLIFACTTSICLRRWFFDLQGLYHFRICFPLLTLAPRKEKWKDLAHFVEKGAATAGNAPLAQKSNKMSVNPSKPAESRPARSKLYDFCMSALCVFAPASTSDLCAGVC